MIGGDAVREAVRDAVREAVEETGFEEPEQGYAQATAESAPDSGDANANADAAADPGDGPRISPADLEKIDRDPRKRALYQKMIRAYHERAGAALDPDEQQALAVVEAMRSDPQGTARAMVKAVGLGVRGDATLLERATAHLARTVGQEAADALAPAIVATINEAAQEYVAPFAAQREQQQKAAENAALKASISDFGQRVVDEGGDWSEETQREMAHLVTSGKVRPGEGTTLPEFLATLHSHVTARRSKESRRAPADRERRPGGGTIRAGMKPMDAVRAAVAAAKRDLGV